MQRVAECSFSLNTKVLKIIGFYPSSKKRLICKVHSYGLFVLLLCPTAILSILHYVFITDFNYDEFIMVGMIFYPLKFIPFVRRETKHKEILLECVRICRRNSKFFFVTFALCIFGFFVQSLLNLQKLPVEVWMPRWVKRNSLYFYIEFLFVLLGVAYAGLACAVVDPLVAGMACQALAQVKILKENLQHIRGEQTEKNSTAINEARRIYREIGKYVRHHQRILYFVNEYEICFSQVVFSQFTSSGIVIGLLCFQISKSSTVDFNFVMMLNYLFYLFFQIFFYCYYGTGLLEEVSKSISDAVYLSRWYECDIYSKRALITLMERSKKPMIVTAGKLFDLSLETFILILKRAYSLLAVLKNY